MKQFRVVVNGNEYRVAIEELQEEAQTPIPQKQTAPPPPQPAVNPAPTPAAPPKAEANGEASKNITAAMPGTILEIKVSVGDIIQRGQALMILEAMKMENEIMASCDGVVDQIHTAVGASVNSGDLLIVLE